MEETSSELLDGRSDCRACAHELILLARQRVYIISQNLEPDLYNSREIFQHLTSIATNNRKADIRIIAHNTRLAANQGALSDHPRAKIIKFCADKDYSNTRSPAIF